MRSKLFIIIIIIATLYLYLRTQAQEEFPTFHPTYIPFVTYSQIVENEPYVTPTSTECEYCNLPTALPTNTPLPITTPTFVPSTPECEFYCETPTTTPQPTVTEVPTELPKEVIKLTSYQNGKHHFGEFINNNNLNAMVYQSSNSTRKDFYYLDLNKPSTFPSMWLLKPQQKVCYSYYMTDETHSLEIHADVEKYYDKNYFGDDVRVENVQIVEQSLQVTLKNYSNSKSWGNFTVALYDENDVIWNCLTMKRGITLTPGETAIVNLNELYTEGYHFIKRYEVTLGF